MSTAEGPKCWKLPPFLRRIYDFTKLSSVKKKRYTSLFFCFCVCSFRCCCGAAFLHWLRWYLRNIRHYGSSELYALSSTEGFHHWEEIAAFFCSVFTLISQANGHLSAYLYAFRLGSQHWWFVHSSTYTDIIVNVSAQLGKHWFSSFRY